LITGGLVLFIAASLVAASATAFEVLLGARLAQALGACAVTVAGRAIVRDKLEAREAARTFSLLALIGALAPILAPSAGAAIIQFGEWRTIFLVMGTIAVLVLVAQIWFLPESRSQEAAAQAQTESPMRAYASLLKNKRIAGYLLAAGGNGACMFTYIANSAPVIIDGYGLSPADFSLVFGLNAIGLLAANQLNRHLLKNHDISAVLRVAALSSVSFAVLFGLFAATHAGGLIMLSILLFAGIASTAIVQANVMAGALSVDPLRAGAIAALYGATTFAFGMLASSVAALAGAGRGGAMAVVIALGFALCAGALHLFVLRAPKDSP
jgi:DHA1 family bicyclomycin/chloramphenicol resistance-like MFS transporter